jgi:hypothetical protein
MTILRYVCALIAAILPVSLSLPAQQPPDAGPSTQGGIRLALFAETKSGQPVTDLDQRDFTVLDNKTPRPIRAWPACATAGRPMRCSRLPHARPALPTSPPCMLFPAFGA